MSAPREHTSAVPIRSAQIMKDLTTAHVIVRDIMEMQRTVNRVSSAKFYFDLIIHFGLLTLRNDDYFISKKKNKKTKITTYSNNETLYYSWDWETNRVMRMTVNPTWINEIPNKVFSSTNLHLKNGFKQQPSN